MAYDNGMCAHVWAQQSKPSGKSSNGNLNFEGPVLYSYSTPIGRFVETVDGRRAVLVTSQRYSITTSGKHMPALWRAIDYGRGAFAPCFTVPELGHTPRSLFRNATETLSAADHAANLEHLAAEYSGALARARRARDLWGDLWGDIAADLAQRADSAVAYAEAFGLEVPAFDVASDAAAVLAWCAEREAKRNAPGYAEKQERERAARAERKERREREAREKVLAANAEAIADWRAGRRRFLPYGVQHDGSGGAMLRVQMAADIETGQLQTSLGATVPLPDAIRVFRFVKLCKERGEAWHRNGRTLPVGAFQVDHVAPNGTFRAGCHLIHWPEIEAAARAAGVLDIAPADTREGEAARA